MPCQCRTAVLRVYRELRESGDREDRVFDAAVRVYQHYHPERQRVDAYQTVSDWLDQYDAEQTPPPAPR